MIDQSVNGFIFPNSIIDELLPELSHSELKCYLAVLRKTKGWNREEDYISVSQFMKVTGLSNRSVIDACESLVARDILDRKSGERNGNIYSIKTYKSSTSEKTSLVKIFPSTSEKTSPVTSEKTSHTKNNIKNNIQNKNNTLTGITKSSAQKSALAILHDFGIDGKLAEDFIVHRKAKRAAITETALAGFQREADKAGISIQQAVAISVERGWVGFKADWNWRDNPPNRNSGQIKPVIMDTKSVGWSKGMILRVDGEDITL